MMGRLKKADIIFNIRFLFIIVQFRLGQTDWH